MGVAAAAAPPALGATAAFAANRPVVRSASAGPPIFLLVAAWAYGASMQADVLLDRCPAQVRASSST